jgi:YHS domain-containing protein
MRFPILAVLPTALLFAGCGSNTEQAQTSPTGNAPTAQVAPTQPVKLTATQELAKYCRVCVVDKGEKIEEFFPSRLDTKHKGKTYKFCADHCKKKFDSNPKRYAVK